MQRGNLKRAQKENKGAYQNRDGNLCLVQNMQQYQRALTPVVDKENQRKVQRRVKLDNYALEKLKERQSQNDLYLNYNMNPFMLLKKRQKRNLIREIKNNKEEIMQVVQMMTPFEKNERRIKKSMRDQLKQLGQIKLDAELKSQKTINMVHNYLHEKEQKQKQKKKNKLQNIVQQKEPQENREIQEILQIKQNRYMFQSEQKLNVFKLIQDDSCVSMLDHITKHNFCFNSHIERNYKLRIPIFRELSTMGRHCSTNCYTGKQKIIDFVFSDELTLNMKELSFNDVLSIANNRLSCQYIYNKLYEENTKLTNEASDEISEEQDLEFNTVIFRKTDRTRPDNFVAGNEEIEQISAYKKIELKDDEKKFKKKTEQTRNEIIEQLERQTQLCLNNIMDLRLHSTMGNNAKQKLRNFMVSKQKKSEQFERKVRQKKQTSDKKQLIKLREFKKMLDERNKMMKIKTEVSRGKLNQTLRL